MYDAIEAFKRLNGYVGEVTFALMRYISFYNEYCDNKTRELIYKADLRNNYRDALIFKPTPNSFLME